MIMFVHAYLLAYCLFPQPDLKFHKNKDHGCLAPSTSSEMWSLPKDIFGITRAFIFMCVFVSLVFIFYFKECFRNHSNLSVRCKDILVTLSVTS